MTKKNTPVKYKKAPQAPRRFKSSYMFFSIEKHKQIRLELAEKGENSKPSTTEVAKMVSAAWKALSHDEREVFEDMARRDKARYEVEKTMYAGPWKVPAKKRASKDPNAPKRPMSAFLSFSNSKRPQVKAENPDLGNAEISRILAQMWKDASEEERKEHIDKEFKLRREYKVAIAEWRKESEGEMEATRKEREEEAMRAAMSGKEKRADYEASNDTNWNTYPPYYHHEHGYHHQNNSVSPVPYGYQQNQSAVAPPYGTTGNVNQYPYGYPAPQGYYSGGTVPQHYGQNDSSESWSAPQLNNSGSQGPPPQGPPYYYPHGHIPSYYGDQTYSPQYPPPSATAPPPPQQSSPGKPYAENNDNATANAYNQGYGTTSQYYPPQHDPYGQPYYGGAYPYAGPSDEGREGTDANYPPPSPAGYYPKESGL